MSNDDLPVELAAGYIDVPVPMFDDVHLSDAMPMSSKASESCKVSESGDVLDDTPTHEYLTPDEDSLLPLLYAEDQQSGWGAGMRAVTHALLADVALPDGAVVEVGCGSGQMVAELHPCDLPRTTVGVDLHPLALAHAQSALPSGVGLVQAALPNLPWRANQVALVVALDVFDQQGVELAAAIAEAYRVLRRDGALVMRVSAHPSLYGAHDVAFHTGQRYRRDQVEAALVAAGFVVQRLSYANMLLSLPVAALRLAQRWGLLTWQADTYSQGRLHQVAAWLLHREAAWLRHTDLPWGLSLCAVARKP